MWQDYALTIVQISFCIPLVPMILAKEKPPLVSSIPVAIALLLGAATVATLHLWLAAGTPAVTGIEWAILAYQKIKNPSSPQ